MPADIKTEILLDAKNTADAAFAKAKQQMEDLVKKNNRSMLSMEKTAKRLKRVLIGALAGVGVAGVVRGFNSITDAAASAEETANKVRVVFGDQLADTLDKWARGAADAMGLAKTEALDAVGSIGYMFQQIGASSKEAVGTSQNLVQLAADIASFNNVAGGAAKVLEDMQSAFRGEYDPIQKYVGTINAAAVEQEALARTGKKTKGELTQLEKTMAAVAIITRDAGVAAGDYARTSGSLVNQQRELETRTKNLREEMGRHLIPAKTALITKMNEWLEANSALLSQNMAEWVSNFADNLNSLASAAAAVLDGLAGIAKYAGLRSIQGTLDQAVELSKKGYLDLTEFARLGLLERQRLVDDILAAQARIAAGPSAYPAGDMSEHEKRRLGLGRPSQGSAPPPPPIGSTGQGVFDTSTQAFNAALDSAIADYQQMAAAQVRIPDKDLGIDLSSMISLNIPDDEAERSFREIQEMIDRRNAMMEQGNNELLKITQYTAEQMQNAFADFFFDAMTGQLKSLEDYIRSFLESMARAVSEAIAQMLIQKAIGDAASSSSGSGGGGGGNYGWVGALVNLVATVATRDSGGPVAPGQMYEIGVPEILHTRGKQYLMMGGNQGGYVEPLKETGAGATGGGGTRIINVLDPSVVEEWANSPSGEQVILNIIRRNE